MGGGRAGKRKETAQRLDYGFGSSVSQSVSQSASRPAGQPVVQCQPVSQSVNQSVNQSEISQSVSQPASQSVIARERRWGGARERKRHRPENGNSLSFALLGGKGREERAPGI